MIEHKLQKLNVGMAMCRRERANKDYKVNFIAIHLYYSEDASAGYAEHAAKGWGYVWSSVCPILPALCPPYP